jgi:GPH family glycoside/pentoside/hexuronide:cation symporter
MAGSAALIVFAVAWLRERPEYQGRGAETLQHSMRDVYRNPHARLLLVVFFIENLGSAVLMVLLPYFTHYIMDAEGMSAAILLAYALPNLLFTPAWVWLTRRFGKKPLWVFSMAMLAFAFGGIFFVQQGDLVLLFALSLLAGLGGGCGAVVGPSIQADVIDWDELHTGERKEGAYFAAWNFVRKSATGVTVVVAGFALEAAGFQANQEQTEAARYTIRTLMALFPAAAYVVGTLLFLRFRLNQAEHEAIRAQLDARRSA